MGVARHRYTLLQAESWQPLTLAGRGPNDTAATRVSFEDLIESVPRPASAWRRRANLAVHPPIGAVVLLLVGLVVGSIAGFVVGYQNSPDLAGLGYLADPFGTYNPDVFRTEPLDPDYGRPALPTLSSQDLAALGEQVDREIVILSAQSAIPVLCGTSIGQPGSSPLGLTYPAKVFDVVDGRITELVWSHPEESTASTTLHTLVFQAQLCPDVGSGESTIRSSGVLSGLGNEYVVFSQQPVAPSDRSTTFSTTVVVRVGADLIEIAFTSDMMLPPDAEIRCRQIAAIAVQRALGG